LHVPPPTAIFTLSLHDALPICEVAAVAHAAYTALGLAREHGADLHRLDPRILDGLRGLFDDELARFDQHLGPAVLIELVRIHHRSESTRLNSSHVAISYAVFCL